MTRRRAGLVLLIVQVAVMGSLALKLLVDRQRLPRAWVRTAPFDPSTPLRGRYVRLALEIPIGNARPEPSEYRISGVRLRAVDGRVVGELSDSVRSPRVQLRREGTSQSSRLAEAVAFFIPENVPDPSRRPPGEELWAEVTIPPSGPPRPIRLGVMRDGRLTPLDLR